ncbi:MAG: MerR family transcriptional regulator [Lachnospiraceae bacterium]|nr:MerR family transcriptional regulator [Lachnospiraceae bacterium]MBQ6364421.1 MerR family transcriptional regulator [Lachnospiraceae bacterium]
MEEDKGKSLREVCEITGATRRGIQNLEKLGLIAPLSTRGVRNACQYDEATIIKLREILIFQECGFSIAQIKTILEKTEREKRAAIRKSIKKLEERKERIEEMIAFASSIYEGPVKQLLLGSIEPVDIGEFAKLIKAVRTVLENVNTPSPKIDKNRIKGREREMEIEGRKIVLLFSELFEKGNASEAEVGALIEKTKKYVTEYFVDCHDVDLWWLSGVVQAEKEHAWITSIVSTECADYISEQLANYSGSMEDLYNAVFSKDFLEDLEVQIDEIYNIYRGDQDVESVEGVINLLNNIDVNDDRVIQLLKNIDYQFSCYSSFINIPLFWNIYMTYKDNADIVLKAVCDSTDEDIEVVRSDLEKLKFEELAAAAERIVMAYIEKKEEVTNEDKC